MIPKHKTLIKKRSNGYSLSTPSHFKLRKESKKEKLAQMRGEQAADYERGN